MNKLPFELDTLQQLIDTHHLKLQYQILADIPFRHEHFPLYSVELGGEISPVRQYSLWAACMGLNVLALKSSWHC